MVTGNEIEAINDKGLEYMLEYMNEGKYFGYTLEDINDEIQRRNEFSKRYGFSYNDWLTDKDHKRDEITLKISQSINEQEQSKNIY